ncbi:MAG: glucosyl transferase, partial [Calditrichaeota bacterium]
LLPFSLFLFTSCQKNTTPVQLPNPQLTLSAEAGVIEAWLTVTTEEATGMQVVLTRDGAERLRFSAVAETTVVDTGLLPAHSYTYAARLVKDGQTAARSNSVQLTTMDTTSHNFSWEIYEFGGVHGSSVLYDVAIINENDIWAVGEIYSDSAQPWLPYNAVHWNGSEWELKRIPFIGACSAVDYPPLRTVGAFNSQEIYFSNGGSIVSFDGSDFNMDCGMNSLLSGAIIKIWGTDSDNLYTVGGGGSIVHYDGSGWRRIESGTELSVYDIWGYTDAMKDNLVLAIASLKYQLNTPKLLEITPSSARSRYFPIYNGLHSLWFASPYKIYVCGGGIHVGTGHQWTREPDLPEIFYNRIRGTGLNDIWAVGDFGVVVHFNGFTWRHYPQFFLTTGNYESLAVIEGLAVAVGWDNGNGIILRLQQ